LGDHSSLSDVRLLVSVSEGMEAVSALDGGADIIDAKNPLAGPLGMVTSDAFQAICRAVRGARPITAALGEARDAASVECAARDFVSAGAWLVKVGFAGIDSDEQASRLLKSAVVGASSGVRMRRDAARDETAGVVAVAYADADRATSVTPDALVRTATEAGARGVLLDTFDKEGPGVRQLLPLATLAAWVARAQRAGLFVAIAGRLDAGDLAWVRRSGADVAGVRGAACEGGRAGRVTSARVRLLHLLCQEAEPTQVT
jgi:(5-formylfuran-3-yl)methyl phosphate synthase